jgi:hypothetical protein
LCARERAQLTKEKYARVPVNAHRRMTGFV